MGSFFYCSLKFKQFEEVKTMQEFLELFKFEPEKSMLTGIERECFLTNGQGKIAPIAHQTLQHLKKDNSEQFGFELSACQLEDRVGPCKLSNLKKELITNDQEISKAELELGFKRSYVEVAPSDMPLDVYPDPTGRYQRIVKTMPKEVLLAACRIIGTHVHIGMPNHEVAMKTYNKVINHCDELCRLGDGSNGKRLKIYKIVAPECQPKTYKNWDEFYQYAVEKKFVHDPRSCWHLIRMTVHGTIEFRMFGPTTDLDKIVGWAEKCHKICYQAMTS